MYNLSDFLGTPLTKEGILKKVSPEEIFEKYLGVAVKAGTSYSNPLRRDLDQKVDKTPSCVFYKAPSGNLYFNDWSYNKMYSCFDVVMIRYNLNFYNALKKIFNDFNLGTVEDKKPSATNVVPVKTASKSIQAIPTSWTKESLKYWAKYGIDKELLSRYFVYNIKAVYTDKVLKLRATSNNPIYSYLYPPTIKVKIYRPLSPTKSGK